MQAALFNNRKRRQSRSATIEFPELFTNGTFDSNADGWLGRNSPIIEQQPSGVCRVTIDATAWAGIYQQITVEDGASYRVQAQALAASGASARLLIGATLGATTFLNVGPISVPQDFDETFSVSGTTLFALFMTNSNGSGNWVEWDNLSLKRI